MGLWINDSGASTAEIEAGVAAAEDFFENVGCSPLQCAMKVRELSYRKEGDDWHVEQEYLADYWREAENAAFAAAFEGWAEYPPGAVMVWEG